MEHYRVFKIRTKEKIIEWICDTVFFKHTYLTKTTLSPEDVVVKSLKDLETSFRVYITQSEIQMEALEHLTEILTTTTATTTATGDTPTDTLYPRLQRDVPVPRVPTSPPRAQNSLTPVSSMVVEYPQATEYKPRESPAYNTQYRAAKCYSINQ